MRNFKNFIVVALLLSFVFIPNFSRAANKQAYDDASLREAINSAGENEVIELTANISLVSPIEFTDKTITINGAGHTITKADNWSTDSANGSLLTAGSGARLNLINLTLTNAQKYGVQAYNGGYVSLDNVTISDCAYGGVLVNAGTVEVKNLFLKKNGGEGYNNGIEIAKGESLSGSESNPKLVMNGTISSTETDQVIYVDINDPIGSFDIVNTDTTVDKVLVSGDKLVVTDQNNNILYQSNQIEDIDSLGVVGETFKKNVMVNIQLLDKSTVVVVREGDVLSKDDLISRIDFASLGFTDYTLDGFYLDPEFTTEYDYSTAFTNDITLYAKITINQPAQDVTPKTGIGSIVEISLLVIVASLVGIVALRKKLS